MILDDASVKILIEAAAKGEIVPGIILAVGIICFTAFLIAIIRTVSR